MGADLPALGAGYIHTAKYTSGQAGFESDQRLNKIITHKPKHHFILRDLVHAASFFSPGSSSGGIS